MSRYMVDKLMWQIDRDDEALAAYASDPAAFVAGWEAAADSPRPPYPDGGRLTDPEREAFVAKDAAALYEMGADPYLLWHYVRAVLLEPDMTVGELSDTFKESIRDRAQPDWTTWRD